MEKLPVWLQPINTHLFKEFNIRRITNILRRDIYEHLISRRDETVYFDLEFVRRNYATDISNEEYTSIVSIISADLQNLNWKTKLSFNDTGLFIYSTELPPPTCW